MKTGPLRLGEWHLVSRRTIVLLQLVAAVVSFFGTILVVRRAGLEARGILSTILTLGILIPAVGVLSLDFAIPWYAGRNGAYPELSRSLRLFELIASVAIGSTTLIVLPFLGLSLSGALVGLTSLGVASAGPTLLRAGLLRAQGVLWIDPLQGLTRAVVTTLASVLTADTGVLVGSVAGSYLLTWFIGELIWRRVGMPRLLSGGTRSSREICKTLLSYGGRLHFGTSAVLLSYRLDQLIIVRVAGAATLGIYSTAVAISEALLLPATALTPLLFVEEAKRGGGLRRSLGGLSWAAVALSGLAGGLMIATAGPVSRLLIGGPEGDQFRRCMLWLALGTASVGAWRVISLVVAARGNPGIRSLSAVPPIVLTVVGNLVLFRRLGATTAAAVSSMAYMSGLAAIVLFRFGLVRSKGSSVV